MNKKNFLKNFANEFFCGGRHFVVFRAVLFSLGVFPIYKMRSRDRGQDRVKVPGQA